MIFEIKVPKAEDVLIKAGYSVHRKGMKLGYIKEQTRFKRFHAYIKNNVIHLHQDVTSEVTWKHRVVKSHLDELRTEKINLKNLGGVPLTNQEIKFSKRIIYKIPEGVREYQKKASALNKKRKISWWSRLIQFCGYKQGSKVIHR